MQQGRRRPSGSFTVIRVWRVARALERYERIVRVLEDG